MGDKVISEQAVNALEIAGRKVYIMRLIWQSGGVSYDVYEDTLSGLELLTTDESFDTIPDVDQLSMLLSGEGK